MYHLLIYFDGTIGTVRCVHMDGTADSFKMKSLDIKWQDDILKEPRNIKDNVKEEKSLNIEWQDDILKDPLNIKDESSLDIKWQDEILKDPFSIKDIKLQDNIRVDSNNIKDEGKYV